VRRNDRLGRVYILAMDCSHTQLPGVALQQEVASSGGTLLPGNSSDFTNLVFILFFKTIRCVRLFVLRSFKAKTKPTFRTQKD